ncbi:hypothetical protein BEP19_08855 [Ammoniphilus oxalaticus]|uniref:Glycerophosphoryl diester phosphodiesterase membrane domain-containing protein n=2 Tax=Ammoniphilus oxalaticus TaxID=66863 RepID=A0A419SKC2_9BACL|nr:hypothetical protein BEP19_08855 [Ammoniphilus oxalaticus]
MTTLRAAFHFYSRHIEYLMILSFSILLPLLFIQVGVSNYVYRVYQGTPFTFFGDISNSFFMFFILVLAQIPFIRYVWGDLEGEERKLRSAYLTFFERGLSIYGFGILYVIATMLGSVLFIAPGLIVLVFFFLTPYVSVIKDKPASKSWREAVRWGKQKFFPLLGIVLLISVVDWLLGFVTMVGISMVTKNYGAILGSQLLVSLLCFPFLVIYMTLHFQKWLEDSAGL